MPRSLRRRFWIETSLAAAAGVLAIVTVFWHDWVEAVFGINPDKGSGSAEWLAVIVVVIISMAMAIGARLEWRHVRLEEH